MNPDREAYISVVVEIKRRIEVISSLIRKEIAVKYHIHHNLFRTTIIGFDPQQIPITEEEISIPGALQNGYRYPEPLTIIQRRAA